MEGGGGLAHAISARLSAPYTASAGRRFGVTVGAALVVLSLIARWRGHPSSFAAFLGIGTALALAGLLIPTKLEPIERAWMALAHALSKITTPIFMGVVYFVILTPIALLRRMIGGSALVHRAGPHGFWADRSQDSRSTLDRQF